MQSSKQSVEKSSDLPGQVALAKRSKEDFQSHLKVSAGFDPRLQSSCLILSARCVSGACAAGCSAAAAPSAPALVLFRRLLLLLRMLLGLPIMAPLAVAGGQGVVRFPGGACAPKVGSPACPKIRFLILEEQDLVFGQLILYGDRLRDPVRGGVPGLCLEARRAQGAVTPSVHRGVPKSPP